MKQHEFIWMTRNVKLQPIMGEEGLTEVDVRPGIKIVHNCKRKDEMWVIFTSPDEEYLIPNKTELEKVYKLHLMQEDLNEILRRYCNGMFAKMK